MRVRPTVQTQSRPGIETRQHEERSLSRMPSHSARRMAFRIGATDRAPSGIRSTPPEPRALLATDLRRALQAALVCAGAGVRLLVVLSAGAARRNSWRHCLGECLASVFESLGGGYLKIGQILATRADLLPPDLLTPLRRLHDQARSFPAAEARRLLEASIGQPVERIFSTFDPMFPIVEVRHQRRCTGPCRASRGARSHQDQASGIETALDSDARLFTAVATLFNLASVNRLPLDRGLGRGSRALRAQTDFRQEAETHRRFQILSADDEAVRIPQLLDDLCGRDVLVMEYLPGLVRLSDPALAPEVARRATLAGLRALYRISSAPGSSTAICIRPTCWCRAKAPW